jgi:predicted amidohydrolase YtcJ
MFSGECNLKNKTNFMKSSYQLYALSFIILFTSTFLSCGEAPKDKTEEVADLIIYNAEVATVNPRMPEAEALAVRDGRILKVGNNDEIGALKGENTEMIDADGRFVMPGFIEGHAHFSGLGKSLINVNLLGTKSWEEVVKMVGERVAEAQPGEWIEGRGWHQEKWTNVVEPNYFGYPDHEMLSAVSPDNPVVLRHASGHGLFANAKAMEAAGISPETPDPKGGAIIRDNQGEAIGVFEERAMKVIMEPLYEYLETISEEARLNKWKRGIELAEEDCLSKGVTSFQDAGSLFWELEEYEKMAENGELDVRLWAMVRHPYDTMVGRLGGYPKIDVGDGFFTCRAIKSEVDGALGAFGAWLLRAYNDKPDFSGQNTTEVSEVERIGELAYENDMQLCVHAIGDRANREVLDIFEKFVNRDGRADLRWRVEHAQHLDTTDIPRFAKLGAIASMQAIHCTSDAPFVEKRLGKLRSKKGAYAWRSLLDAGAVVTNGTDAPVEDVDPIESFYASVTRKRADNGMAFFTEQRMTREEALYSYTMANAFAAFEEKQKGSLEEGKLADMIILSNNLLTCPDENILKTKVLYTIVDGKVKYKAVD